MSAWRWTVAAGVGLAWMFLGASCASRQAAAPTLDTKVCGVKPSGDVKIGVVERDLNEVGAYERIEFTVDLSASFENPYDAGQVDLGAVFTSPKGRTWNLVGFYDGRAWKVRFAPNEEGLWQYRVTARTPKGGDETNWGAFRCIPSGHDGWVRIAPNRRYFAHDNGRFFYEAGCNRHAALDEKFVSALQAVGVKVLHTGDGAFADGGGVRLLESIQSGAGRLDPEACGQLDRLIAICETRGIRLSYGLWPRGLLDSRNPAWKSLSPHGAAMTPEAYCATPEGWALTQRLVRYAVARWGYSRALFLWNVGQAIDETDPWRLHLPSATPAVEWCRKVSDLIAQLDPFGHPTTASVAGGASASVYPSLLPCQVPQAEMWGDRQAANLVVTEFREMFRRVTDRPIGLASFDPKGSARAGHYALWASFANGGALPPALADAALLATNAAVRDSVAHHLKFAKMFDFPRMTSIRPADLRAGSQNVTLPKVKRSDDLLSADRLSLPEWATGNKSADGTVFKPQVVDFHGVKAYRVEANLSPKTIQAQTWQEYTIDGWPYAYLRMGAYEKLKFDVFLEYANKKAVLAVNASFANQTATGVGGDLSLTPGAWQTVDILVTPDLRRDLAKPDVARSNVIRIKGTMPVDAEGDGRAALYFANFRIENWQEKTIPLNDVFAPFAMRSDQAVYGWVAGWGETLTGSPFEILNIPDGLHRLVWFNPRTGSILADKGMEVRRNTAKMMTPESDSEDLAFALVFLR